MFLGVFMFSSCFTRKIDENYAEKIVKEKLSIAQDVKAQKLTGGFSGAQLFTVTTLEQKPVQKYVIRFLTHKSLEERAKGIYNFKVASRAGYGPHIFYANKEEGVVIMEYLEQQPITGRDRQSDDLYIVLAKTVRTIHHGPKFEGTFDPFRFIAQKIELIAAKNTGGIPLAKIKNIATKIQTAVKPFVTYTPCHNDLNPSNLIYSNGSLKVIDYEEAAQGDPYLDLATVGMFFCRTKRHKDLLLKTYLARKPMPQEQARFFLMRQVVRFGFALWYLGERLDHLSLYKTVPSLSQREFGLEWAQGKIDFNRVEDTIKYAKVLINHALKNIKSQEFQEAVKLLTNK